MVRKIVAKLVIQREGSEWRTRKRTWTYAMQEVRLKRKGAEDMVVRVFMTGTESPVMRCEVIMPSDVDNCFVIPIATNRNMPSTEEATACYNETGRCAVPAITAALTIERICIW